MKILSFLLFFLGFGIICQSQGENGDYPVPGATCPDFHLSDVEFFSKREASLQDFKGKWLVLDFWNSMCTACIHAMPETNNIQKEFSREVKVLLVGYTGSQYTSRSDNQSIRRLYDRVRKNADLALSIAYDSTLFQRFDIVGCPFIVVIDPKGIVRAVTSHMTGEDMKALIDGKSPKLAKVWRGHEEKLQFDVNKPFLIQGNGGCDTDYLFRSVISKWASDAPSDYRFKIINNRMQVMGVELKDLYNYAYFRRAVWDFEDSLYGKIYPRPILELKDSSSFVPDYFTRKNMFCYSLSVPSGQSSIDNVSRIVRSDLNNYFSYRVRIENRMMPCWALVRVNDGNGSDVDKLLGDFRQKFTIGRLLRNISCAHSAIADPFIDDTGVAENINPASNYCNLENLDQCNACLIKYGLKLVQKFRPMSVLVVQDGAEDNVQVALKK